VRNARTITFFFFLLITTGCSGGNGNRLIVGDITGPVQVTENSQHVYSVEITNGTVSSYLWAVEPTSSCELSHHDTPAVQLIVPQLDSDSEIEISVLLTTESGEPVLRTLEIHVKNLADDAQSPVASAHVLATDVITGSSMYFFDESDDPNGASDISKWEWDFSFDPDDGFNSEFSGRNSSAVFFDPGTFLVQLRVTDFSGLTDLLDEPLEISVHNRVTVITFGGPNNEKARDVDVDRHGNVYLTGKSHYDTDFDPGGGSLFLNSKLSAFLSKLDPDLNFEWAQAWGPVWGFGRDAVHYADGYSVAVTDSGNVGVCGAFRADLDYGGTVDFDPGPEEDIETSYYRSSFINFFDTDGNYLGHDAEIGTNFASPYMLRTDFDALGRLYVLNVKERNDLEAVARINRYNDDLTRDYSFDQNLNLVNTYFGLHEMDITDSGNQYVVGYVYKPFSLFFAKASPAGGILWKRYHSEFRVGFGVAADSDENAFVVGEYGTEESNLYHNGNPDYVSTFLAKYDPDGTILWEKRWENLNYGSHITLDQNRNIYITGWCRHTTDFDPGPEVNEISTDGILSYLMKLDSSGNFQWVQTWAVATAEKTILDFGPDGYGYLAGTYAGNMDIHPTTANQFIFSNGGTDIYLLRFTPDGLY